ncbi:hypothetical protein KUCAC02_003673 [Chaenocephalus aceratus]|uniref:Uncharacterized protein n=1 Tax=Chaenocephalus aceratus TaxID=36190 RepID=A0ACB9WME2_CHAAC|nr:hypothetical protein KUCAC02_003673 [Chaenocephalus aceratus]
MGNVESQNGDSGFYGNASGHISRKQTSSTPSIPQSLAENGLEPFNATDALEEFGINPHWTQRVAMTMRPESYQHDDDNLATPTPETSEADTVAQDGGEGSTGEGEVTWGGNVPPAND